MNHPLTPDPRPNLEPGAPLTEPMETCRICRYNLPLNRTTWHECAECRKWVCDECVAKVKGAMYCNPCADSVIEELQERDREEEMYELYGETV